jgi:hypothetical protein
MEFIKKHWEKVLLGAVLVGLAGAAAKLPLNIAKERSILAETRERILNPKVSPLPEMDLAEAEASLARLKSQVLLDFSTGHLLFNPASWQKTSGGQLSKVQSGNEIGPAAARVVGTFPLYTIVSFDNIVPGRAATRYLIGVERQAAPNPRDAQKQWAPAAVGTKTDFFTLLRAQGPPENPEALIFDMAGSDGEVSITRSRPFKRVDGFTADLKYAPEGRMWPNCRVGDRLFFAGDTYIIVAINASEVVLSAPSGKKTTVTVAP